MNINDAFPSKYIKASDLQGQDVPVTISKIEWEEVGQEKDRLPILYFEGRERGLALNKTNTFTIGDIHGQEMDNWGGKEITLFPTQTDFQGKQVACIRVRLKLVSDPAASTPLPGDDDGAPPLSDDVGF